MANDAETADHWRTNSWTRDVSFDYDASRAEQHAISEALYHAIGGDFESLKIDAFMIDQTLVKSVAGNLNVRDEQARAVMARLFDGLRTAIHKTDWRLGYGKVRNDATIPEAAASLGLASFKLLEEAFSNSGMRAYRNRTHDFIEAMAEFAEQANGGQRGNATFYQKLGERVAKEVLDHNLAGPMPRLMPQGPDYVKIETAAMEQLVYFIQAGDTGPVKIGIAKDPNSRLSGLQTAHHETLHLRAITVGGMEQEREYHVRFAHCALRGEWFEPHTDILAEIERLNA